MSHVTRAIQGVWHMHLGPGGSVSAVGRLLRFGRRHYPQIPGLLVQDSLEGRRAVAQENLRGSRFSGRPLERNIIGSVKPSKRAPARFVRSFGNPGGEFVVEQALDRAVFAIGLAVVSFC
jgi:hypothetical protein